MLRMPRVLFRSELAGLHTLVVDSMRFSAEENVYLKLLQLVAWQCSCRGGGAEPAVKCESFKHCSGAITLVELQRSQNYLPLSIHF